MQRDKEQIYVDPSGNNVRWTLTRNGDVESWTITAPDTNKLVRTLVRYRIGPCTIRVTDTDHVNNESSCYYE